MAFEKLTISKHSDLTWLNLAITALSLYVVVAILFDMVFDLDPRISKLINLTDNIVCVFFFVEFVYRLSTSSDRLAYLKWGWLDLVSSIPMVESLRFARVLRIIRFVRIVRAFMGANSFIQHYFRNKAQGTLYSVAIIALLVVMLGSLCILQVENAPNSNIKTAGDALWWSYVTIMTVGYGDKYPVTAEGRIIGAIIMSVGVVLVSTMAGYVASWFFGASKRESESDKKE
ncbi:MAG: potassium channel family protein [Bacteroidota bacterium]